MGPNIAPAIDFLLPELERLAAAFDAGNYEARVVTPEGRRPYLDIRNRRVAVLTEHVYAGDGWYWWGWAERVAPVTDPPGAARKIADVLQDLSQAGHRD